MKECFKSFSKYITSVQPGIIAGVAFALMFAGVTVLAQSGGSDYFIEGNAVTDGLEVDIDGNASANPFTGQPDAQFVSVDWGDGSGVEELADHTDFNFTDESVNGSFDLSPWSGMHVYSSPGNYTIEIRVHHASFNGNESSRASISFDVDVSYACSDGLDNDGDGFVDEEDPGCEGPEDNDEFNESEPEVFACSDGLDNDQDGLIDGDDPGCDGPEDNDEFNEPITGLLTLVKIVGGGDASPTDWTLSADGPTPISGVLDDPEISDAIVETGSYSLSETGGPEGYNASTWECSGNSTQSDQDNTVIVGGDEDVTCTITNTFIPEPDPELGSIHGQKFEDLNGNGVWDNEEPELSGWTMWLFHGDDTPRSTVTDGNGMYWFSDLSLDAQTAYRVCEELPDGWIQTYPYDDSDDEIVACGENGLGPWGYEIYVEESGIHDGYDFRNFELGTISGKKFNDTGDTIEGVGEGEERIGHYGGTIDDPNIPGWLITLELIDGEGPLVCESGTDEDAVLNNDACEVRTNSSGNYEFIHLFPGVYRVSEEDRGGWKQTRPTDELGGEGAQANGTYELTIDTSGDVIDDRLFGNLRTSQCLIEGFKYDEDETPLEGWTIGLGKFFGEGERLVVASTVTDSRGHYCITEEDLDDNEQEGRYVVFEELQEFWDIDEVVVDDESSDYSSDSFFDVFVGVTLSEDETVFVDFYNEYQCVIDGHKYDSFGIPLPGWEIGLALHQPFVLTQAISGDGDSDGELFNPWLELKRTTTDENGFYCFTQEDLYGDRVPHSLSYESQDLYAVFEVLQDGWNPFDVKVDGESESFTVDNFFDVFVEIALSGGREIGYDTVTVDFYNESEPDEPDQEPSAVFACSDGLDNDGDELIDIDDPGCHTDGDAGNIWSYDPKDNDETHSVFFGGGRTGRDGQVLGASIGGGETGGVAGASCGMYLTDYLHINALNDPAEVVKLQEFLNEHMGAGLEVTGVFDQATFDAVVAFQAEYSAEVLGPWGLFEPTGYVYITTQRWINLLKCEELSIPLPDVLVPNSSV